MQKNQAEIEFSIKHLVKKALHKEILNIQLLPASGSNRLYYRLFTENETYIATYNEDARENNAFIYFSNHFKSKSLPVPEVLAIDTENYIYIQNDLGDDTLFSLLMTLKSKDVNVDDELFVWYKRVVDYLIHFQIKGFEDLDTSYCFPRAAFDKQSMMWDLNYFKYYFLKLSHINFDEQNLENDFEKFTKYLLSIDSNYFLYRDFQSRNIMIKDENLYFIDYQGGRKGALQYDLASLLYDAKADLSISLRKRILEYYISELLKHKSIHREEFILQFYCFVLIRIMQAMGAYGYRGFYERKELFLQSIPYAVNNLNWILQNISLPVELTELQKSWNQIIEKYKPSENIEQKSDKLTVTVYSFSFKKGYPVDNSGNGGGFVFDCRAIHNPGKYEEYKKSTGSDENVKEFLKNQEDIHLFLKNSFDLVDASVQKYLKRGFNNLMASYGCTGGQHRSVYSANTLAAFLKEKYKDQIEVRLIHREQPKLNANE